MRSSLSPPMTSLTGATGERSCGLRYELPTSSFLNVFSIWLRKLTTALCPSYPATLPSRTSIPKQHRSNRFVHTLHTASSQDGYDVHRSAVISFRYRQFKNRIQTHRVCSNRDVK